MGSSLLPTTTFLKGERKGWSESETRTIGIDTEWYKKGDKNRVLTYQLWCEEKQEGIVVYCKTDKRWTWKAMISEVHEHWGGEKIVFLAHYNLAEISTLRDSKTFLSKIPNIRNLGDTINFNSIPYSYYDKNKHKREVKISLLDTYKIAMSSLDDLGKQIGFEKISNPLIGQMDVCLKEHPVFYFIYSIVDAMITTAFYKQVLKYEEENMISGITTGSQIGQKIALTHMSKDDLGYDRIVKKIKTKEGGLNSINVSVLKEEIVQSVISYHGARNETYVHGIFPESWYDYDVSGAYSNAMLMIQQTDWENFKQIHTADELEINDLGHILLDFKFHDWVKFPSFPVPCDDSLVFPTSGYARVTPLDLWVANKNGWLESYKIRGSLVFIKKPAFLFHTVVKQIQDERMKYPKGNVLNLMWKLAGNGLYGKLTQGIRQNTEYDLEASLQSGVAVRRTASTGSIFNPAIAAFITAALRCVCSEYANRIGETGTRIINVTTDGLQINRRMSDNEICGKGMPLTDYLSKMKVRVYGDKTVTAAGETIDNSRIMELKHINEYIHNESINISIQTRNYFMFNTKTRKDKLLSRGGVSTKTIPKELETDYLLKHYLTANRDTKTTKTTLTGIQEVMNGGDLVTITSEVRKNYDFDVLKRKPVRESIQDVSIEYEGTTYTKVRFDTEPWGTVGEAEKFYTLKIFWKESERGQINKLQTKADLIEFLDYIDVQKYADTEVTSLEQVIYWKVAMFLKTQNWSNPTIARTLNIDVKTIQSIFRARNQKWLSVYNGESTIIRIPRSDGGVYGLLMDTIMLIPSDLRSDAISVLCDPCECAAASLADALMQTKT